MTPEQIAEARKLAGKMSREEIASTVGTSVASLKRGLPGVSFTFFNRYSIDPELVARVTRHYEAHGLAKTQEAFPEVRVRSVVERYKIFSPRQIRWTDEQIAELARMGGLISDRDQAHYFKRPRANAPSIKSIWQKRFRFGGGCINGMSHWCARELVNKDCPFLTTNFWASDRKKRKLFLWVDMEKHLRRDLPQFVVDAIKALADFQRWLFQSDDPKPLILSMINERETPEVNHGTSDRRDVGARDSETCADVCD